MKLPDTSRLAFDEKKHAYSLDGRLMSGVTSVIDGTSSKANLINWAANMAVDYVSENARVDEINHGFDITAWETLLKEARTAHTRRKESAGQKGTDTHALVEDFILKCISSGGLDDVPFDPSIMSFANWAMANDVKFIAAEQRLYSEKHDFAGTCDFVAIIDGKLTIGDLKTFPKMWSADAFIQMGAYSIAWEELTGSKPAQSVVVKMCDPED